LLWQAGTAVSFLLQGQRLSVAIIMLTLAASAHLLARGVTSMVAARVLPPEPVTSGSKQGATIERMPGADPPDVHAILARNIFDPTTGSLWPPKPVDVPAPAAEEVVVDEEPQEGVVPPACDGSLKLIGSVFSEKSPEWSFASLSTGSDAPMLYRQGSKVQDKEVVQIMPSAVYMRSANRRLCSLLLFVAAPTAPPPAPAMAAASGTPITPTPAPAGLVASGSITETELDSGITANSDTKFTVQRSFVDRVLQNQAEIMRSARIVPHEENGQVVGVKLYGIRRNSLLGKLGLQNGDLLRTINGYAMASPDSALEAYAKLRTASDLSVAVVRRGKDMTVDYNITGDK
jgi:general secretion pathway protein C